MNFRSHAFVNFKIPINNFVNRTELLPILELFHSLFLVASA